ncbi:hypothetical protein KDD17_10365 [Sulfitobacter albidus]|uniref:Gamma-glutamyl kinase n=1 Tax=Sulfitobacter albidus TaxID=2829501 RepID=A0A975JBU1_9RHOB|nr:hypothetical protein [Sulfitobacter albidus]QUJ75386.1 hypothetical protein KDD17_10365 [Sulfitobacter albidus]
MLIFLRHELAFLANPKTGTTAVEMALKPRAEIVFAKRRKHLTAQRYIRKVLPFLQDTFGKAPAAVAVMRDPVDQVGSWYRYRNGARLKGSELSTDGMSFDAYVREVAMGEDAPPRARIGSQHSFLTDRGDLMVHHLFAYEAQPAFRGFLERQLDMELKLKPKNVSPPADTRVSAEARALLEAARPEDFALYARLRDAGGYLETDIS